jgi:hypothetical protein
MIVNLSRTLQMLPVVVLVTVALFGVPCGQGRRLTMVSQLREESDIL